MPFDYGKYLTLWNNYYRLEKELNEKLENVPKSLENIQIYNRIKDVGAEHRYFLRLNLRSCKKVLFIGMTMETMYLKEVDVSCADGDTPPEKLPPGTHSKRPVDGLEATRKKPFGKRAVDLLFILSNGLLFKQCFVHNFCTLEFYNSDGDEMTASELKGVYKQQICDECLNTANEVVKLIQPEVIVAIDSYVFENLTKSEYCKNKRLLLLPQPSTNNNNWEEEVKQFLIKEDLMKHLTDEANAIYRPRLYM